MTRAANRWRQNRARLAPDHIGSWWRPGIPPAVLLLFLLALILCAYQSFSELFPLWIYANYEGSLAFVSKFHSCYIEFQTYFLLRAVFSSLAIIFSPHLHICFVCILKKVHFLFSKSSSYLESSECTTLADSFCCPLLIVSVLKCKWWITLLCERHTGYQTQSWEWKQGQQSEKQKEIQLFPHFAGSWDCGLPLVSRIAGVKVISSCN